MKQYALYSHYTTSNTVKARKVSSVWAFSLNLKRFKENKSLLVKYINSLTNNQGVITFLETQFRKLRIIKFLENIEFIASTGKKLNKQEAILAKNYKNSYELKWGREVTHCRKRVETLTIMMRSLKNLNYHL